MLEEVNKDDDEEKKGLSMNQHYMNQFTHQLV